MTESQERLLKEWIAVLGKCDEAKLVHNRTSNILTEAVASSGGDKTCYAATQARQSYETARMDLVVEVILENAAYIDYCKSLSSEEGSAGRLISRYGSPDMQALILNSLLNPVLKD
jgi:hypothetical protein